MAAVWPAGPDPMMTTCSIPETPVFMQNYKKRGPVGWGGLPERRIFFCHARRPSRPFPAGDNRRLLRPQPLEPALRLRHRLPVDILAGERLPAGHADGGPARAAARAPRAGGV